MLRDIVFDLGGVLIDWDPRYLFRDRLGAHPGRVDEFLATVCTAEWHAEIDGGQRLATMIDRLAQLHPEQRDWIERYATDWESMFAGSIAESVEYVERLDASGFRLHALTNYPAEQIRFLYRAFPFMRRFHTVVVSGLVRATKPDARIYEYLLQRIGSVPCLFVDDRQENVEAARRCGMQAVRYVRGEGLGAVAAIVGV